MASQFDLTFNSFSGLLDAYFAKSFIYRRKSPTGYYTANITATLQAHEIVAEEKNGLYESWHGHHFVVYSAELILDGVLISPTAGDEILELQNNGSYDIFQVLPPPNKRVSEPIDPEEYQLLVFAKFTKNSFVAIPV